MGNTAKMYFSPTLGSICERLKLSYDVAGVTFLAMGNGAPDLFGAVSSFTGKEDTLIGLGALLGGSVFVSSVVVVVTISNTIIYYVYNLLEYNTKLCYINIF